jgi:hypothetical protein
LESKLSRLAKNTIKFVGAPFWLSFLFVRGLLRRYEFETPPTASPGEADNPFRTYFQAHRVGPGIWKWDHYFDIYQRHFSRFRGKEVHVLEIGIYSGGSLGMWREYFGPKCQVYGVDIEPVCKSYERDGVTVFIGNQADRSFWKELWRQVPRVDIIIDDGGHRTDQQIITLEETLAHLHPGGVYLCEDVHGRAKGFTSYINGFNHRLSAAALVDDTTDPERRLTSRADAFQAAIESIHLYPFVTVIEKRRTAIAEFVAPKHGSEWQPFA